MVKELVKENIHKKMAQFKWVNSLKISFGKETEHRNKLMVPFMKVNLEMDKSGVKESLLKLMAHTSKVYS